MTIVDEIRSNREEGAKRLEAEYKAGLMVIARKLCTDESDAEALVSHTFAEVVNGIGSYTEQSAFFAWMCKIMVNCHQKSVRRKSNETVVYVDAVPDMPGADASSVVEAVDAGILRDAIEGLPPEMKEAVVLRYFMDQPVDKIAKVLAVPAGTVKSRLHYARILLGKKLGANLKKPVVAAVAAALFLVATAATVTTWAIGRAADAEKGGSETGDAEGRSQEVAAPANGGSDEAPAAEVSNAPEDPARRFSKGESEMNNSTVRKAARAAVAAVALGATATAQAATWTNGNWSVAENWAEGVVPAAGAAVTISNLTAGATFNVDVDSVNISSLTFASGGKQCYVVGGTLNISAQAAVVANHSMTISNALVLSSATVKLSAAAATSERSYYCGDVTLTHATGDLYSFGKGGSTFYGTVTVPRDFRPGNGALWQSGSHHYFYGPLKCRHVLNASSYDDTTYHYESTSNSWTYFETGNYVRNAVATAGALPKTAVLRAYGSDYYAGGTCSLNGTDQTIDRLSGTKKQLAVNGGSTAMTLTLLATASDTSKAALNGSLSLVYAPTNSSYVQTVNGGVCSMNGSLTVSNGTFRAGATTKFANVTRIVVADGATFDLATTNANALAGVTSIEVGALGRFAITNTAATPFTASAVDLVMDESATFELPADANYLFKGVTIGGVPLEGDTYSGGGAVSNFTGTGSITVPAVEKPTVDATWDGGGDDDGMATPGNWDGDETPALGAASLYPLFATGGTQATIDRALDFKGVHFGGAAGRFDLVSGGSAANLTVRQLGFAVDATHTNAVDVPVKVKSDQTWSIGANSMLQFKQPVSMNTAYAVTVAGSGVTTGADVYKRQTSVLRLDGDNGFLGDFTINNALVNVYSTTNAFGPASDTTVTLSDSQLYLHGGVIERPVTLNGQNNEYYWFRPYGTNVFTKMFTQTCTYWRPQLKGDIITEGGVTVTCQVFFNGDAGTEWTVRGKPWKHTGTTSAVCQLEVISGSIRFEVDGNLIVRLFLRGGQVHCGVDNPFSGRSDIQLNCNNKNSTMHLHGHEVSFGTMNTMSSGTIDSDVPGGVLRLSEHSTTITNVAVRFTGAAGFEMGGTGAVVFTNAMESAGRVGVTRGRLEFTETGSWLNCTNVTASGTGRLKIAQSKVFHGHANLAIADSGVVELAEGACPSFHHAFIGGIKVKPGLYSGEEGPANAKKTYATHFAGKGAIRVYGDGFLMVFH